MKLVVGLGNIGPEYEKTRHNIGFMSLDEYAKKHNLVFKEDKKLKCFIASEGVGSNKNIFIKPTTYMNLSGDSLILVASFYKIPVEDILVICDALDSNPGRIRLRANGSSGGHNGLKSIFSQFKTEEIKRLKIGIGRDKLIPVVDYVLGKISSSDLEATNQAISDSVLVIEDFVNDVPFMKIASKYSKK